VDELLVRPGRGIGPIELGMTRSEVTIAALAAGLAVEDFSRGSGPKTDLVINRQLFVYFDADDRVLEAEVGVPESGDAALIPVSCLGLPLAAPYDEVLRRLHAVARVDETDPEYPGTSAFLDLGLVLWAEVKADDVADTCVQAILVRRPEPYPIM
jgi:hypothetical protein